MSTPAGESVKYLVIENKGPCEPEFFMLMGASTKRNDSSAIGQFGTGYCYSMAVLLREKIGLIVVGGARYTFGVEPVTNHPEFEQVTMRTGKRTPVATQFTTGLGGVDWDVAAAVRELVSNAYDSAEPAVFVSGEILDRPGYVRIYVQYTDAVKAAYKEFDRHFTFRRTPLLQGEGWAIYTPWGAGTRVYRRGVLVFEDLELPACFDYRSDVLEVREDRKSDRYCSEQRAAWIIKQMPVDLIRRVTEHMVGSEAGTFEGLNNYLSWHNLDMADRILQVVNGRILVSRSQMEVFSSDLFGYDVMIMPDKWVEAFRTVPGIKDIGSVIGAARLKGFTMVDVSDISSAEFHRLTQALVFAGQAGLEIEAAKVLIFESESGSVNGSNVPESGEILVNRSVLAGPVRDVVKVLFEQYVRLADSESSEYHSGFRQMLIEHWVQMAERFVPGLSEEAVA